jgi:hypothetical protein
VMPIVRSLLYRRTLFIGVRGSGILRSRTSVLRSPKKFDLRVELFLDH